MAYTDKVAEISFKDIHFDITWNIIIYDREAFAGTVTELVLTGSPATKRIGGKGYLWDIIHGTEVTINIIANPTDDYDWIKTADNTRYKVEIKKNTVLNFVGFILPDQCLEDYAPYRVLSIICSDRLGLLGDEPYVDSTTGAHYEGRASELDILVTALDHTGLSLPLWVLDNLYESAMDKTAADDPIKQSLISQNKFLNEELEPTSCKVVIEEILRKRHANIKQVGGVWHITRTPELAADTIKYRSFLSDGQYDTNGTLTINKDIDTSTFRFLRGTQTDSLQSVKIATVEEDYGLRKSLFVGYNFPFNEFGPLITFFEPTHWNLSPTTGWRGIRVNDKYIMSCPTAAAVTNQYMISVGISVLALGSEQMRLTIKGGAYWFESGGISSSKWDLIIKVEGATHNYFFDGSDWIEDTVTHYKMSCKTTPYSDPIDHTVLIDAWPVDGTFTLSILDKGGFFISEIILLPELDGANPYPLTDTHSTEVNLNNRIVPDTEKILFTDSNVDTLGGEAFYDGLIMVGADMSVGWTKGSGYYTLWEWMLQDYIDQFTTPSIKLRAVILGDYEPYQVIKALGGKYFVLDDVEIDLRRSIVSGTFIEIKADSASVSLTETTNSIGSPASIGSLPKSQNVIKITNNGMLVEPIEASSLKMGGSGSTSGKTDGASSTPFTGYRSAKAVALTAGANVILFSSAFATGSSYTLYLNVVNGDGDRSGYVISDEVDAGFTITVEADATMDYNAILEL